MIEPKYATTTFIAERFLFYKIESKTPSGFQSDAGLFGILKSDWLLIQPTTFNWIENLGARATFHSGFCFLLRRGLFVRVVLYIASCLCHKSEEYLASQIWSQKTGGSYRELSQLDLLIGIDCLSAGHGYGRAFPCFGIAQQQMTEMHLACSDD